MLDGASSPKIELISSMHCCCVNPRWKLYKIITRKCSRFNSIFCAKWSFWITVNNTNSARIAHKKPSDVCASITSKMSNFKIELSVGRLQHRVCQISKYKRQPVYRHCNGQTHSENKENFNVYFVQFLKRHIVTICKLFM